MTDATLVLDTAWKQIDKAGAGYIYGSEFVLLIDAVDSVLQKSLLNDVGKSIIRRFSNTDGYKRVYKADFKTIFESLVGISFAEALEAVKYDEKVVLKEREKMHNLERLPAILTSTPNYDDGYVNYKAASNGNGSASSIDPPNFKKEFKKLKRLSDSKDEEIKYRDEFIDKLENQKKELESKRDSLKELQRLNTSLEQDVLFRDDIILERDQELKKKQEIIIKLEKTISLLHKEIDIYKSDNANQITQFQLKKKEEFNKALLERVKQQQQAIEKLNTALFNTKQMALPTAKYNTIPKTSLPKEYEPLSQSPFPSSPFKLPSIELPALIIPLLILFVIVYVIYIKPNSNTTPDDKWYTNTFLESFIFNLLDNREIDYDYYKLDDVELDFMPH